MWTPTNAPPILKLDWRLADKLPPITCSNVRHSSRRKRPELRGPTGHQQDRERTIHKLKERVRHGGVLTRGKEEYDGLADTKEKDTDGK